MAIVFGAVIVLHVVALIGGTRPVGLYTSIYVLLLPYALFRWGSGREVVLGLAVMLVAVRAR